MMLDEAERDSFSHLRELGAQDYLIRGQLQDALVHRILDYNIQLKQAQSGGFSCSFGACDGSL